MKQTFSIGDNAVNVFSQEVLILDIDDESVVFEDVNNDSVDVLRVEEFNKLFQPIQIQTDDFKSPTRREFREMVR